MKAIAETKAKAPNPTPPTTTPPPIKDDVAPANDIVNFSHSYVKCPKLSVCPAHKDEFEVYTKTLNTQLPPPFPLPYTGSGPTTTPPPIKDDVAPANDIVNFSHSYCHRRGTKDLKRA